MSETKNNKIEAENFTAEKFKKMAQQSLAPDSYEMFAIAYNEILKNRGLTAEPI